MDYTQLLEKLTNPDVKIALEGGSVYFENAGLQKVLTQEMADSIVVYKYGMVELVSIWARWINGECM